jgi:hypothetical protein
MALEFGFRAAYNPGTELRRMMFGLICLKFERFK